MIKSGAASRLACFWFAIVGTLAGSLPAEEFHDDGFGFHFTVPDGWIRIPDESLQEAKRRLVQSNMNERVVWVAAYQLSPAPRWMTYPYLLVQVNPYATFGARGQLSSAEIRGVIREMTGTDPTTVVRDAGTSEAKALIKDIASSAPRYDPDRRRFTLSMVSDIGSVGEVEAEMAGYFGRDALVSLNVYSFKADAQGLESTTASLRESFRFDADKAYDPALDSRLLSWIRSPMGRGAIVGGISGGVAVLAAGLLRRRKA